MIEHDKGMALLYTIVEWRKYNKPRAWIARELGLTDRDVTDVLRVYGDTKPDHISLEKYDRLSKLVLEGCSLTEIRRTLGADPRTTRRWFPNAGWGSGGAGASLMRRGNDILEELELK